MSEVPRILLVDDGELEPVVKMLDRLRITHTRLRGSLAGEQITPPRDLLVTTPRRAESVRRGSPPGAEPGRPLRIIAVDEDSNAMRRMLRRMGFHLLVRRGAHADVWRLLVERALFEGDERRVDPRVPVGAAVSFESFDEEGVQRAPAAPDRAVLIDISNRGCRLSTPALLEAGTRLSLGVPMDEGGDEILRLTGRLVRTRMEAADDGRHRYSAAMLFDAELSEVQRTRLGRLLNDLSVGPGAVSGPVHDALPSCESPVIPGLVLDDETDPALPANVEVGLQTGAEGGDAVESGPVALLNRRQKPRGSFAGRVVARRADPEQPGPQSRVLIGRDLSSGGMRIESATDIHPGDRFQLAIYGPGQEQPFLVNATVDRDDGERGLALRFTHVPEKVAEGLEKLVACLPDIESLEHGESGGLGAVISEILSRSSE